jgi:DNA-binding HxlR family transcriptional regulator
VDVRLGLDAVEHEPCDVGADDLGVAPNTLSARLSEFTEAGLLDREAYDEIPPRVEYTPAEQAEGLFPVFAHLHHWAMDNEL